MYDVAIVGAGINGCAVAYYLSKSGKKVALVDKEAIAAGGSGAAGAFVSPKFSKAGELKELMEKAFPFALDFYATDFPALIHQAPLVHIAKDESDALKLVQFNKNSSIATGEVPLHVKETLTCKAKESQSIYVLNAGVVDAQGICRAMSKDVDFFQKEIQQLHYADGYYEFDGFKAKEVVLAYGAYEPLITEPYINLRGIWGYRIDIATSTKSDVTMHHHVSISSTKDGNMAIGATHDVHYHPQKNKEPYDVETRRAELLKKATLTIELHDVRVLKDYMGLRSGSNDYIPLVGRIVKSESGDFYPNLSMINGVGGYGFVLAPYIAKQLSDYLTQGKEIDSGLLPERFYKRWLKKQR